MAEFCSQLYSFCSLEQHVRDDDIAADPVFEFDIAAVDTVSDTDLPVVETVDEDSTAGALDDASTVMSDSDYLHHISDLGQEISGVEFPTGPDRVVYEFDNDDPVMPTSDWSAADPDCAAAADELVRALSDLPPSVSWATTPTRLAPGRVADDRPLYALARQCKEKRISAAHRYKQLSSQIRELSASHKVGLRAHFDGGASASTTDRVEYLWALRPITNSSVRLRVADGKVYEPSCEGFLRVPVGRDSYKFIPCFYTPGIAATIISPSRTCDFWRYRGVGTYVDRYDNTGEVEFRHPLRRSQDISFPCSIHKGLLFSERLMKPTVDQRFQPLPPSALHVVEVPKAPAESAD